MTDSSKTNTRAVRRNPCKLVWFKFYPTDFFPVMRMTNEEAGIIFKNLLENLAANEAPKNSPEERMIEDAKAYSEWKRQVAYKRWNKEPEKQQQQKPGKPPRAPKLPPPLGMENK